MLFNYQFIPFLINQTTNYTNFELKSDRHILNLKKYYAFFFLVTIALPITGVISIGGIVEKATKSPEVVMQIAQKNMLSTSTFFIRYVMTCTFMSSCIVILDIGHQLYRLLFLGGISKGFRTQEEIEEDSLTQKLSAYKDFWFFDIGY